MIQPIKPDKVVEQKVFPDAVIEAFNELITQNFDGKSAKIKQADVVTLMVTKGLCENEILEKHWLDVEDVYRKAGWIVAFDKAGYCEQGGNTFIFTQPE